MARISEQRSCDNPKVSVGMLAYNHEAFIAQAIESVLMQETDFPVELVIGEDCSPDGTRGIVHAYAQRYPHVIRALLPDRNRGGFRNSVAVLDACCGEYVALCDGDDYWTDPHKLQKQVALMDQNPHLSMCGTAADELTVMHDGTERRTGRYPEGDYASIFSLEYVLLEYPFRTVTVLLRNRLIHYSEAFQRAPHGDICIFALCADKGPAGYINEVTAVYRIHGQGAWSGAPLTKKIEDNRLSLEVLNDYFAGRYARLFLERDFRIATYRMREAVGRESWSEIARAYFGSFTRFIRFNPRSYLELGRWLLRRRLSAQAGRHAVGLPRS
jgi:glycosyltransferase involved in cell wall biosynthesis